MASKKKNMPEQTAEQQVADYLMSMLMTLYVFVMLVIYPLFYQNKYYDMGDAKYTFFKYMSIFFLIFFSIFLILWLAAYREKFTFQNAIKKFSKTDWFAAAFLVFSYLSYFLSDYKVAAEGSSSCALTGYSGWYMGLVSQVMFVLIYFAVSRFWKWSPFTLGMAVVAAGIANQLAIWHRFSIDPLGMYENLAAEYIEKFVSTLGQTTWFSSYAVLLFPVVAFLYWKEERLWARILSGFLVAIGYGSLSTVNSDSAYVAFVLILMTFFWFSLESNTAFQRFLEIVLIGLVSFRAIGIMQVNFPEKMIQLITGDEKISFFITQSYFMQGCLIVFIILYLIYCIITDETFSEKRKKKFEIRNLLWLRKLMLVAAAAVLAGVVLLIVLATKKMLPHALEGLYKIGFFNFDNQWGNCRGFNWRMAVKAFSGASFKDVLVGVGPDCFAMSMDKYCAEEVAVFWQGMQLACAHNEFLNMLVTQGLLGVTAYLGIFISFIVRCISFGSKDARVIPFMAAALAYVGHNFFCYQQCICTPIVFIMMGIGEMLMRNHTGNGKMEKDAKKEKDSKKR